MRSKLKSEVLAMTDNGEFPRRTYASEPLDTGADAYDTKSVFRKRPFGMFWTDGVLAQIGDLTDRQMNPADEVLISLPRVQELTLPRHDGRPLHPLPAESIR
jgi:hypothetical protein